MGVLSSILGTWNGGAGGGDLPPGSVAVADGDPLEVFYGNPMEDQFFTLPASVADGAVGINFGAVSAAVVVDASTPINVYKGDGVTESGQVGVAKVLKDGVSNWVGIQFLDADSNPSDACVVLAAQAINLTTAAGPTSISGPLDMTDPANPTFPLPDGALAAAAGDNVIVTNANGNFSVSGTVGNDPNTGLAAVLFSATQWAVEDGDVIAVIDANGVYLDDGGTIQVDADTQVQLLLPANVAAIVSDAPITGVAPSGAYTNTVKLTVVNGVVTAITLS